MADQYELYYWPVLAGRAEFVRLILEEIGLPYKEVSDNIPDLILKGQMEGYPAFTPPVLKKGNFVLGQTPVICRYLGQKHGLYPESDEDQWHADQLNVTIHDFLAEGCLVFHGKAFTESYNKQKEETQPYIDWFEDGRMQRWLQYFERALTANNGGKGFVIGQTLTYVDLALLHLLRATASHFPRSWEQLDSIPLLKAFKDRLSSRPRLAAYFKSDRCRPFEGNSMM